MSENPYEPPHAPQDREPPKWELLDWLAAIAIVVIIIFIVIVLLLPPMTAVRE